jgi:CheY-like chemotaxis protein
MEAVMRRILVVDDDTDTCQNLADLFGELGYGSAVVSSLGGANHVHRCSVDGSERRAGGRPRVGPPWM